MLNIKIVKILHMLKSTIHKFLLLFLVNLTG